MKINSRNSFKSLKKIKVRCLDTYNIFSLKEAEKNGLDEISKLPKVTKSFTRKFIKV